ncbi:Inactive dipeptidyl peptidase 10 [Pseudolycoriella hygida]|uniref:Venom dipeptidyl peptidase 4 n=1 Tax=Pseudolycoriella hygida TaxID=35572 RepID=A0A9Q0NDC4_9DIPT|nr:Inactive dipeptidyl peptidase 10 [Pseudolycoriella hygida]
MVRRCFVFGCTEYKKEKTICDRYNKKYLITEDEGARVRGRRLTLSDIHGNILRWRPFNGTWISDVGLVYRDMFGGLSILDATTLTSEDFMTNSSFVSISRQLNAERFVVSPDLNFVLLLVDYSESESSYLVFEVQNRNAFVLSPIEGNREIPPLQNVLWAPNSPIKSPSQPLPGSHFSSQKTGAQAIAFVYENDLYYKPKVQNDLVCRITTTGEKGVIYNGVADWLYANTPELKSSTLAFSTDGSYLSFLSFNDSLVSKYEYTWLGDGTKYPKVKSVRCPNERSINPTVKVYVVDLSVLKFINKIQVKPPSSSNCSDCYVGNMIWLSPTDLSVTFTNREQTRAMTVLCRAPTFSCIEIHTENVIEDGFVLPADKIIFAKTDAYFRNRNSTTPQSTTSQPNSINKDEFGKNEFEVGGFMLKRLPVRDGEHGYYRQVVFISMSDMRTVPLTMGRFEVTEILGYDEANEVIYFMATPKLVPGQRHLYQINLTINFTKKSNRIFISSTAPLCMTCDNGEHTFRLQSNTSGSNNSFYESPYGGNIPNNCLYNKIYFSKDFSHYVQECLGPATPSVYLVETNSMTKIMVLHGGDLLRTRYNSLALPQIRTVSVEIKDGFHAQVRIYLPPGMKEEEEVAFPLIVHMDSSPGSQLVSEKFEIDYNWYFCSQRSMIVAQIDARGSGFQGEKLRSQIKGKLGTVEIEDQLGVLTYLRDNLKFIDPTRICAYGWGYGGYAATMTLMEDSQRVLQCALAINPIVSFEHHVSFFTERYMPRKDDNSWAIQESDLTYRAGNIDSRNYFLIHGTADLMVHEQHSLLMARSLIDGGIGFRHQIYSDQDHTLNGVFYHLFKTIEWFFDESFGPVESGEWDPTGFFSFKQ